MTRALTILSFTGSMLFSNSEVIAQSEQQPSPSSEPIALQTLNKQGSAYWVNGFRKNPDDTSADQLAFETNNYGFIVDIGNLTKAHFGRIDKASNTNVMEQLPEAELLIQVARNNQIFTATHSLTGAAGNPRRLQDTWMWEAGRYVQHYDLHNLIFEDKEGNKLSCAGTLKIVSWPDSLTLTSEITPEPVFKDGPSLGVSGNGHTVSKTPHALPGSDVPLGEAFTLETWVNVPNNPQQQNNGWLLSKQVGVVDDGQVGFYIRGNRIEARMNIGAGHHKLHRLSETGHKHFNFDGWHHLALSYDGKTMRYYVDGHQQGSKAVSGALKAFPRNFQLGSNDKKSKLYSYGSFDQVRLWNKALTAKEIKAHHAKPDALTNKGGLAFEKTFDTPADPKPSIDQWQNSSARIQLIAADQTWEARSPVLEQWSMNEEQKLTLTCNLNEKKSNQQDLSVTVHTGDGQAIEADFTPELNCHLAEVKNLKREWKTGYTDIRDYDEFTLELENKSDTTREIPFMLYLRKVANITGLVPILCHPDGTPTGIHVQLSKNWHYPKLGSYLRAYSLLPVAPGKHSYKLRIAYGFYGTLPSASHAQLSLIGYGGNNRWDQLAIGCWGETICFDTDRSLVDVAVTDVRMLMARKGKEGQKWSWTEAGWGGDWIRINNAQGKRHHPNNLKTSYHAHGPCLTDARYTGNYGIQDELSFDAQIQTLRTDDYARTFQKFSYTFDKEVSVKDSWLFKMGRSFHYTAPKLAYGNASGLIQELEVPNTLKKGESLIEKTELQGQAPWWISFPGSHPSDDQINKGNGYRALVIRSYSATLGGKTYSRPSISAPVHQVNSDDTINLDLTLTAPAGVTSFQPGDTIKMDLEWVTLHRKADDYYGPNELYRKHLTENPNSWKTIYREALGNDLTVDVEGGELHRNYPIQIQSQANEVKVKIKGGVGYVPIHFNGLKSATGYTLYQIIDGKSVPLDQSVHGNDFWQTDYDAASNSFSRVYNLPLDQLPTSEWVLKKESKQLSFSPLNSTSEKRHHYSR
ncbi:LamG domain-containing protein [Rubritalea spongiae]|uniref:LamG domain-containing protein n=1 Tax=Rubritalea spongiae TaxID=430797 RepID=A0ABW5E6A6_9BACT